MGYSWVSKGSAIDKSFTYGNSVYKYNSISNTLDYISSSGKTARKQDLMFVFRNLQNAVVENNELKIYVNYYKLN